ncbi:MAG: S8 family serine peptidase, partial [Bacteroidota bacterium]
LQKRGGTAVPEYGTSFVQLNSINVVEVHAKGITGQGVIIGMIDDGFSEHRVHTALRNINVLAEYDFIQRDENTMRAPGEYSGQGNHGAGTLSVVGGYEEGKLIGAAYGASFLLAKTEIDSVEIQIEEDLYIEGLEWLERNGADIISSSLGYIDWYTYADLDGKTATTTNAARILARKGILLVTAMGNEGTYRNAQTRETGTMIAPADADSILSVGASFSDGEKAGFSSTGPTADGRVKPEVVAQGVSVYAMYGEGGYTFANGTSFSTPLAAGVAALILSAHPELTPMEVRARMISTARPIDAPVPNNFTGAGMLDALEAVGFIFSTVPDEFVLFHNYPNPFNAGTTIVFGAPGVHPVELVVFNTLGQRIRTLFRGVSRPGENRIVWNDGRDDAGSTVATGLYLYRLITPASVLSGKMLYLK